MKTEIKKEFGWEGAHRLVKGFQGKCANIHGHSFLARVTLALKPQEKLNQFDFVEDFVVFKALRSWVDVHFDHAMLICKDDKVMLDFLVLQEQKHWVFYNNPTSETIALFLYNKARELYENERIYVSKVEVDETCTSSARVAP